MRLSALSRLIRPLLSLTRRFAGIVRRRKGRILAWTALVLACTVAGAALAGYLTVRHVVSEIHHVPVNQKDLGKRPPVYSTTSMNILVFGSDSRAGLDHHQQVLLHTGDATTGGNNSDTIMVLHISPGRHLVTAMSIPRDTMVPRYQCDAGGGHPGQQANLYSYERINSLLAVGGPQCLWKTVEQVTGIHLDHFIEIGLGGFVNVINDLGGVNVCAPFDINNSVSGLVLPAGEHHIDGVTALAFWRTRENIGEGSDLQRITRDQFMSAQVVKGILATGLLGDPIKLFRVLSDLAPNLTIDSAMSLTDLLHLGQSLHGLSSGDVQFVTAPVGAWPYDPNAVGLAQPAANAMFAAIAHDAGLPKGGKGSSTASPSSGGSASASASASGSGSGPASAGASAGVSASSSSGAAAGPSTSASAPGLATGSGQLAGDPAPSATAGTVATPSASASDSAGPSSSASPSDSATGIKSLAANNGGINADAACTADAAAFAGPNSPSFP